MKPTVKLPDGVHVTTVNPELKPGQPWTGYVHPRHIKPNPNQPRKVFPNEDQELLQMSHCTVGQQRAVYVIPYKDDDDPEIWFMIHDGERSWRSLSSLGCEAILVTYNPISSTADLSFLSFVANFGGKGHTHGETIDAVWDEIRVKGRKVKDFAHAVTRSEVWVNDYLVLHNLHPELRALMDPPTQKGRRLPFTLALTIAKAKMDDQIEIFKKTAGLSAKTAVRHARGMVTEDNRVQGRERKPSDDWKIVKRILATLNEDLNYLAGLDPKVFDGVSFDNGMIAANLETVAARVALVYRHVSGRDIPLKPDPQASIKLAANRVFGHTAP